MQIKETIAALSVCFLWYPRLCVKSSPEPFASPHAAFVTGTLYAKNSTSLCLDVCSSHLQHSIPAFCKPTDWQEQNFVSKEPIFIHNTNSAPHWIFYLETKDRKKCCFFILGSELQWILQTSSHWGGENARFPQTAENWKLSLSLVSEHIFGRFTSSSWCFYNVSNLLKRLPWVFFHVPQKVSALKRDLFFMVQKSLRPQACFCILTKQSPSRFSVTRNR